MPIDIMTMPAYLVSPQITNRILRSNATVDPHRHSNFYEIDFILSGFGSAKINETEIEVSPGDIFFSTPLDVHSYTMNHGDIRVYCLSFSEASILPEYQNILFNTKIRYAHISNTENLVKAFDIMFAENEHNDHFSNNNMTFCLNMILAEFIRTANIDDTKSEAPSIILNIVRYIRIHATESLTLDDIAKAFNISPQHLSQLFRKKIGMGFKQYLISLRLDLAKNLLTRTDMTITAICYEVGFSTLENFVRIFKKNNGMTPSEYRKKYKK